MTAGLEAWEAALPYANTQLLQVIVEGDSTFAGQTLSGDPYSPITRLRERLADAGINDGGHGVMNGYLDTETVSGEPSDAGVTDEPAYDINNAQCLQGNYTGVETTAGEVYEAAVYGTQVWVRFAKYAGSVVDIEIDGEVVADNLAIPAKGTPGGSADANWQAAHRWTTDGLTAGRHVVKVTLVSGWLSVLIGGHYDTGVVLNNFAARARKATDTPWHQVQDWAGLVPTNAGPVIPANIDDTAGSFAPVLGIFAKGINDQQGNSSVDTSEDYYDRAYDFARAFIHRGASAIICSPWWESANQAQLAPNYRAASIAAAEDAGAYWIDLGTDSGGALDGHEGEAIGGSNNNPHLTALAYQYQGDHLADALLATYEGPASGGTVGDLVVRGRTVSGLLVGGVARTIVGVRRGIV